MFEAGFWGTLEDMGNAIKCKAYDVCLALSVDNDKDFQNYVPKEDETLEDLEYSLRPFLPTLRLNIFSEENRKMDRMIADIDELFENDEDFRAIVNRYVEFEAIDDMKRVFRIGFKIAYPNDADIVEERMEQLDGLLRKYGIRSMPTPSCL